jgi:hypothetical protein
MRKFLVLKAKTTCLILVWDDSFCPGWRHADNVRPSCNI